jgi:hypothetical protein
MLRLAPLELSTTAPFCPVTLTDIRTNTLIVIGPALSKKLKMPASPAQANEKTNDGVKNVLAVSRPSSVGLN